MITWVGRKALLLFLVVGIFCSLRPSIRSPGAHIAKDIFLPSDDQLIPVRVSWYGKEFHGKLTASGGKFDMYAISVAHVSLPFGTKVRFLNLINERQCDAVVNDSGPFNSNLLPNLEPHPKRQFDASRALAECLNFVQEGIIDLYVTELPNEEPLTRKDIYPNKIIRSSDRFKSKRQSIGAF